jgi:mannose-6-phosphate isomerase-like protein (cupin superfamily)
MWAVKSLNLMYWEEVVDLINNYHDFAASEYLYRNGTLKTGYLKNFECPPKIKNEINKYHKLYKFYDMQLFVSMGKSSFGYHTDPTNVFIICLEGEISYEIEKRETVTLTQGDTIFIKKNLLHRGTSGNIPRACMSCATDTDVPVNSVTYHFGDPFLDRLKNHI